MAWQGVTIGPARCVGEHLECSPCGKVAGRERCHRLAGPGGAAVALAENQDLDYSANKLPIETKEFARCQYISFHSVCPVWVT